MTAGSGELLARERRLANHGRLEHYRHAEPGLNSRRDALQAAVLACRLPRLDDGNRRRRLIAMQYREALSGIGDLQFLRDDPESTSVYHQMTVLTGRREALREHLGRHGIGTSVHYPLALHLQPAFADLAGGPALEVGAAAGERVLCLPMFPELEDAEVARVCDAVRAFF